MLTDTADKVESVTAAAAPVMLTDVTKRYGRRRGTVPALDRVSLSFAAGSFTAVLGVASCGGGRPNSPAASSSGWRSPGR